MKKVIYEGEATLGRLGNIKPHGHGKIKYLYGEDAHWRYEGDFVNGWGHGWGRWYDPDDNLVYEGEWSEGEYHGQGKLDYSDDNLKYRYEGDFVNSSEHGKGTCTYLDGEHKGCRYEGDFVNGNEHGWGRWYDPDDNLVYEGEWSEGEYHGQGTKYFTDGTQRTGRWTCGEPDDENAPSTG